MAAPRLLLSTTHHNARRQVLGGAGGDDGGDGGCCCQALLELLPGERLEIVEMLTDGQPTAVFPIHA